MRKWNWNYLALAAAIAVIAAAFGVYHHYGAETRIAFVNYPEYILAPLLDQEINPAIRADAVKWTETSGKELKDYDCIIFFGMGLNFTEEQSRLLAELKKPVYTTASTRQETALSTLTEEQRETLAGYLAGGKKNFRRMLDFIRYEIDGKRIRAPKAVSGRKPSLLPHRRGGRVQELPGVSRLVPGERPPQTGRRHGVPPLRQWRRSARRTDRSVGEERSQRRRHQRDAGTRTDF